MVNSYNVVAIAPKSLPPKKAAAHEKILPSKKHIVFTGRGGYHRNPLFMEIIQRHKDKYLAAKKLSGRYDKLDHTTRVLESIYDTWTSLHADNCFVYVGTNKSKIILQKHDALKFIRRKCVIFFREKNNNSCEKKKNEETCKDSISTHCHTSDFQEDSDGEYEVFMV
jgi:hypothetical protein